MLGFDHEQLGAAAQRAFYHYVRRLDVLEAVAVAFCSKQEKIFIYHQPYHCRPTHSHFPDLMSKMGQTNEPHQAPFPSPKSTLPFWRTEPHDLDSHRSTPELPESCDIAIIGAGYAGAATAYHLLDSSAASPPSILILEAREACSGATGRNGGHLHPEVSFNMARPDFEARRQSRSGDFEVRDCARESY